MTTPPKRIAITGAAGNIAYQAMFRIAAGEFLGDQQPIALNLVDIPPAMPSLGGTAMELEDCAFPLLRDVRLSDDLEQGFGDADYVFMFGARPRGKGMERGDLLQENGKIFGPQGKAINDFSNRDVRILVIGNPANTNALIALHHAPDLSPRQFSAMTRLDHERSRSQLASQTGELVANIARMTVWGNHSPKMFPDIGYCTASGTPVRELVDADWYQDEFIPGIQQRGAKVIEARGALFRGVSRQRGPAAYARLGSGNGQERLDQHERLVGRFVRRGGRHHFLLPLPMLGVRVFHRVRAGTGRLRARPAEGQRRRVAERARRDCRPALLSREP